MKKNILFLTLLLILCPLIYGQGNHWTPDSGISDFNMSLTAIIKVDSIEQYGTHLELGAFSNNQLRGSVKLKNIEINSDSISLAFMTIYGEHGDSLTFKMFDHNLDKELNYISKTTLTYVPNGMIGSIETPFVIDFEIPIPSIIIDSVNYSLKYTATNIELQECNVVCETPPLVPSNIILPPTIEIDEIEYTVTSIGDNAFNNCSNLSNIDIPSTISYIGEAAFQSCSGLESIICHAISIPSTDLNVFNNCPSDMIIYVPNSLVELYKATSPWNEYTILPMVMVSTNFVVNAESTSSISLSWSPALNALSYNIYKDGVLFINVSDTSYIDTCLNLYTEYCYTISSVRYETESEQSTETCTKTLDLPISVPTNLSATAVDTSFIALNWNASENALSYNVYRFGELIANVKRSSYADEFLNLYTEYCYTVTSVRNEQESEQSDEACTETLDLPVTPPTNLITTAIDTQSIALSWDADENALSYNVYKGEILLDNVTETYFTDNGLEYDTEYCYSVTSVRNEQESEKSEESCIKTLGESINEYSISTNIYPNPVEKDSKIYLGTTCEKVEIYNTLGVKISEYENVNSIEGIETSGVYVVKAISNGNVSYSRVIVE